MEKTVATMQKDEKQFYQLQYYVFDKPNPVRSTELSRFQV